MSIDGIKQKEILTLLCIQVALTQMAMGLIAPILPQYGQSFGVNIVMVGLLITAFGIARIIVDIPVGRLAEKMGRRPLLVIGPVILSASSLACGLASSYWQLLAFRFVQGLGSAMFVTAAMIMLADISKRANRGRIMSLYQASHLVGTSVGPIVGGFTAEYFGLRAPFFLYTGMAALAAAWAYLRVPETRPASYEPTTTPASGTTSKPEAKTGMLPLIKNVNFVVICILNFSIFLMRNGARNHLLPLFASASLGLSSGQIGIALTVWAVLDMGALFISGRVSDRFGRKAVITPGCIIVVIGLIMLAFTDSYWLLLVTSIVWGVGAGISGSTPAAYMADIIPRKNYSSGMGLYRTMSDLGLVTGPPFLGWIADTRDYSDAFLFDAALLFVSVIVFQVLAKERPRPGQEVTGAHA